MPKPALIKTEHHKMYYSSIGIEVNIVISKSDNNKSYNASCNNNKQANNGFSWVYFKNEFYAFVCNLWGAVI